MTRIRMSVAAVLVAAALALGPIAAVAQGTLQGLPRNETLILENPEGTVKNAGWFNIWAINAGSQSNGLQQAALDTLWYIDPNKGLDGVWDNSLAADKPIYNADFTEMTVKLRRGIFWSDGVEFTAADVVFTVETQIKAKNMRWSAPLSLNVDSVDAPDPAHRRLQAEEAELPLPRPLHGALGRGLDHAEACLREGRRSRQVRLQQAGLARAYVLHSYDPTANGTSGACATIGSAPPSAVSASPVPNISPTSIPVRPTSASSPSSITSSTSSTTSRRRACSRSPSSPRARSPGSRASPTHTPIRRCRR